MPIGVTGDFVPLGSFKVIDGKDVGGALTGSAISSSNLLFASTSYDTAGAFSNVVVADTASGRFYVTSSYGAGGDAFPFTGSAAISGSLAVEGDSGSITAVSLSANYISTSANLIAPQITHLSSSMDHVTSSIQASTGSGTIVITNITNTGTVANSKVTGSFTGSFIGPLIGTSSHAETSSHATTASFSITASHALNTGQTNAAGNDQEVQYNDGGSFQGNSGFKFDDSLDASLFVGGPITASIISASSFITGSFTGSFTGDQITSLTSSIVGLTASQVIQDSQITHLSSSMDHVTSSLIHLTSSVIGLTHSMVHVTASLIHLTSSVVGLTASQVLQNSQITHLSSSMDHVTASLIHLTSSVIGLTHSMVHVTSSIQASTGSGTIVITNITNSGIVANTALTGSFTGSFTGPLTGTSSHAQTSSHATTASFATTASHALNTGQTNAAGNDQEVQYNDGGSFQGNSGFKFDDSLDASLFVGGPITASGAISSSNTVQALNFINTGTVANSKVTGSFTGSFTGPLTGTSSHAETSSHATTASFSTTASHALNTSTPTLQQVTDQGAVTTTSITASIISASKISSSTIIAVENSEDFDNQHGLITAKYFNNSTNVVATMGNTSGNHNIFIHNSSQTTNTYAAVDFRAGTGNGRLAFVQGSGTGEGHFSFVTDNVTNQETFRMTKEGEFQARSGSISASGDLTATNLSASGDIKFAPNLESKIGYADLDEFFIQLSGSDGDTQIVNSQGAVKIQGQGGVVFGDPGDFTVELRGNVSASTGLPNGKHSFGGQSLTVDPALTASIITASDHVFISTSTAGTNNYNTLVINTSDGRIYHTGSYGGGTGGGAVTAITNNSNDNVLTATGGTTINGEGNLTFNDTDGLTVKRDAQFNQGQSGIFGGNASAAYQMGQFIEGGRHRTYVTPELQPKRFFPVGCLAANDTTNKISPSNNFLVYTGSVRVDPGGGHGGDPVNDEPGKALLGVGGAIQVETKGDNKRGVVISGNPSIYFFNADASQSVSQSFNFNSASAEIKFNTGSSGVEIATGDTSDDLTQTLFLSQSAGNPQIGVGTVDPLSTLDVRSVTSSAPANIILRTNEDGVIEVGEETGRIEFAIESSSFLGTGFIVSGSTAAMFSRVVESSPIGAIGNLVLSVNEASALTPVDAVTIGKGATPGFSGIGMAVSGNIDVSSTAPLIKIKNDNGTVVARLGHNPSTNFNDGQLLLFNQGTQSVKLNGDADPAETSFIKFGNLALGGTSAPERLTVTGSILISGSGAGHITASGDISASGKIITTEVESPSDFTLDVEGDITLDANGADIILSDDGTDFGRFKRDTSDFVIKSETNNKDIIFKGVDDSSTITALTLDMSDAGKAIFNDGIVQSNNKFLTGTETGGTTRNILGINSSDVTQVANANIATNIKGTSITLASSVTASIISASGAVSASNIVSSGDINLSTNNTHITQVLSTGATRDLIGFDGNDNTVVGNVTSNKVKLEGNVTASANISASGDLFVRSRTIVMPSTNGYSGDVVSFGSGPSGNDGNINAGELYYLSSSQNWELADADASSTATNMLGIAVADNTATFLVKGIIQNTAYGGFTTGAPLYVSTTAGDMTGTAPSGTGDIVRVVGYSVNGGSRIIYFNPSNDHIVHA